MLITIAGTTIQSNSGRVDYLSLDIICNLQRSIYHSVYVHYCNYILVFQDMKRLKAHELLEKETIKASALRHKLANLPHKLKAELAGLYMHALSNKV